MGLQILIICADTIVAKKVPYLIDSLTDEPNP